MTLHLSKQFLVGGGLCLSTLLAHAQAPLLISDISFAGSDGYSATAAHTTYGSYRAYDYVHTYNDVTTQVQITQTAPTKTSAGLAYVYEDRKYDQTESIYTDYYARTFINAQKTNASSGYVQYNATYTASRNSTIGFLFNLDAAGTYAPVSGPFGSVTPGALSVYYKSSSAPTWQALSTNASFDSGTSTFSAAAYTPTSDWFVYPRYYLGAGQSLSISAVFYTPSGLNLQSASVASYWTEVATTSSHGYSRTLIGAAVLPAIPEPSSWALMLAGLVVVPSIARRSTRLKNRRGA